jgi:PPIC-type PPIASE domain
VRIAVRALGIVALAIVAGTIYARAAEPPAVQLEPVETSEPATIDGCQVIARIDGQVVMACELLWRVNLMVEANRDRIPPDKIDEVRAQLMKRSLTGLIDQKLLFAEFRRNIPAENMPRIEENLLPFFKEREMPDLMKQLDCKSEREVELKLSQLGSSLEDARRSFNEHVIASEWIRSKIKVSEDVGPLEMAEYYRDHHAEFEFPMQARWEELMVRKSGHPTEAAKEYARLAKMGNEVLPRLAAHPSADTPVFNDVAKAQSEGGNAEQGGLYDWTTKGSLKATVVDEAVFTLPLGQMSPILDSGTAFHIVRVLERKDAGCRPFSEVQNDIREKLKNRRMAEAQRKYIAQLRKDAKIWTAYSGNTSVEQLMAEIPRDVSTR